MSEALTKDLAARLREAAAAIEAIPTQGAMFHSQNAMRDSAKWRDTWKRATQSLEEVARVFQRAAPCQCASCGGFFPSEDVCRVDVHIFAYPAGVVFGNGRWQPAVCVECMKAWVPKLAAQQDR